MTVWNEKGQAAIEVALAVGLAIFIATMVGLIAKQLLGLSGNNIPGQTNTVVNNIT